MDAPRTVPQHVSPDQVFDFDIYGDPRIGDDVQASYLRTFAAAPDVFWTTLNGGHWIVRRYDHIRDVITDYEHFSAREMAIPRIPNPPFFIPLSLDPPTNVPYRQALMPQFSPKAVRDMEPKLRAWAARIVDSVVDRGECDFLHDVSSLFPVSVFMELMGMPLGRLREFRDLADSYFKSKGKEALHATAAKILEEFSGFIDERLANPGGKDLISHLLTTDVGGRTLTKDEVLAMCFVLYLGGMDTVTNVVAFCFKHLASDPDLQKLLAEHPERISDFVDEGIRCFSVINPPRIVAKETQRYGVTFKPGDMVISMATVAGLDDRVNEDPLRFDIDRKEANHLTFSAGPHLCVGQILARRELNLLTEEWLKRIPSFRAKPGVSTGSRIGKVTAILSLPLEWGMSNAS